MRGVWEVFERTTKLLFFEEELVGQSTDLGVICDTNGGYVTIDLDIFVGLIVFKPIRDCKEKTSDGHGERNVQAHLTH